MPKYEICIVSKEYRYIETEADNETEARDQAWAQLESALNGKPEDYDTELYIERVVKCRYEVQECEEELRVSIIDTNTGLSYCDYEYDDSSERVHQLMNARRECEELNSGVRA